MEKEIKLRKGFVLQQSTDKSYMLYNHSIGFFLHADKIKLATEDSCTWLKFHKDNDAYVGSIWLTKLAVSRVKKLMEEK